MFERCCAKLAVSGVLMIAVAQVVAQSPPDVAPKDAKANAIAQRAMKGLGVDQIVADQTVLASGALTLVGKSPVVFPVVMKSRGTAELRTELTTPKGVRVTIISKGHGGIRQPDGRVRWLADENTISQRVTLVPALSLLAEYQAPNRSTEYVGTSMVDGIAADVVAVAVYEKSGGVSAEKEAQKSRQLFYIDPTTGLVLRLQQIHYSENLANDTEKLEIRYSDYRQIQGVMVPFHQQTYGDGQLLFDLALNNVSLGVALSDSNFSF